MRVGPYERLSALIRETPGPFYQVKTQWEDAGSEPGGMPAPECDHAGALILNFPASRTVSNTFQSVVFHNCSPNGLWKLPNPYEVEITIITSFPLKKKKETERACTTCLLASTPVLLMQSLSFNYWDDGRAGWASTVNGDPGGWRSRER